MKAKFLTQLILGIIILAMFGVVIGLTIKQPAILWVTIVSVVLLIIWMIIQFSWKKRP